MRYAFIALMLLLSVAAGAAMPEKDQAAVWIEAETATPANGIDTRPEPLASAGALLGVPLR